MMMPSSAKVRSASTMTRRLPACPAMLGMGWRIISITIGRGSRDLHEWMFETELFQRRGRTDELHFAVSPVLLGSGEHLLRPEG